jgi:hypothetical protein
MIIPNKNMKFPLTLLVLLASMFSLEAQTAKELTHEDVLKFAAQAKELRVCKVKWGKDRLVAGIPSGPPVTLTGKDADGLRQLLSGPASYEKGGHRCDFSPGYKITLIGKEDSMDILLCFSCHDYMAATAWLFSPIRSFEPSAQAIKAILDRQSLKDPLP